MKLFLLLLLAFFVPCLDGARIRFFHGSPSVPKVHFLVNNEILFPNVTLFQVTSFLPTFSGEITVSLNSVVSNEQIYNLTVSVLDESRYITVVIAGDIDKQFIFKYFSDVITSPDLTKNNFKVQIFHLDPTLLKSINFTFSDGTQNATAPAPISFGEQTPYSELTPGNLTVYVNGANVNKTYQATAGYAYSIFVATNWIYNLDQDFRPATLRFIHGSLDTGLTTFRFGSGNGNKNLSLYYTQISNFTSVASGDVEITVKTQNSSTPLKHVIDLPASSTHTVVLAGLTANNTLQIMNYDDKQGIIPLGTAYFRFVHLIPNLPIATFALRARGSDQSRYFPLAYLDTTDYISVAVNTTWVVQVFPRNITNTYTTTTTITRRQGNNNTTTTPPVTLAPASVAEGTFQLQQIHYTVFLVGEVVGNVTQSVLLVDNDYVEPTPIPTFPLTPSDDSGLSKGAIAAIVVCSILGGFALIGGIVWYVVKRRGSYDVVP